MAEQVVATLLSPWVFTSIGNGWNSVDFDHVACNVNPG